MALECLADFMSEPTFLVELYVNYDSDVKVRSSASGGGGSFSQYPLAHLFVRTFGVRIAFFVCAPLNCFLFFFCAVGGGAVDWLL